MRVKSSSSSFTPAVWAMAMRCSTAFGRKSLPQADDTLMAFSKASRVMMSSGGCPRLMRFSTAAPCAAAIVGLAAEMASLWPRNSEGSYERLNGRGHRIWPCTFRRTTLPRDGASLDLREWRSSIPRWRAPPPPRKRRRLSRGVWKRRRPDQSSLPSRAHHLAGDAAG